MSTIATLTPDSAVGPTGRAEDSSNAQGTRTIFYDFIASCPGLAPEPSAPVHGTIVLSADPTEKYHVTSDLRDSIDLDKLFSFVREKLTREFGKSTLEGSDRPTTVRSGQSTKGNGKSTFRTFFRKLSDRPDDISLSDQHRDESQFEKRDRLIREGIGEFLDQQGLSEVSVLKSDHVWGSDWLGGACRAVSGG